MRLTLKYTWRTLVHVSHNCPIIIGGEGGALEKIADDEEEEVFPQRARREVVDTSR